jgi:hypothetical protein
MNLPFFNLQFNVTATNEADLKEAATIVETKLKSMDDLSKVLYNQVQQAQKFYVPFLTL